MNISVPDTIFVMTSPIDLRLSFDRLAALVRDQLGGEPRGAALFVFHNRARSHVKLLWHAGRAYSILYVRLDRGTFRVPLAVSPGGRQVSISARELTLLLEGIDGKVLAAARQRVATG